MALGVRDSSRSRWLVDLSSPEARENPCLKNSKTRSTFLVLGCSFRSSRNCDSHPLRDKFGCRAEGPTVRVGTVQTEDRQGASDEFGKTDDLKSGGNVFWKEEAMRKETETKDEGQHDGFSRWLIPKFSKIARRARLTRSV